MAPRAKSPNNPNAKYYLFKKSIIYSKWVGYLLGCVGRVGLAAQKSWASWAVGGLFLGKPPAHFFDQNGGVRFKMVIINPLGMKKAAEAVAFLRIPQMISFKMEK